MSEHPAALPVASRDTVRHSVRGLVTRFRGRFAAIVLVHAAAVACGLLPPLVLGDIVDRIAGGDDPHLSESVAVIALALLAATVLGFTAAKWSFTLGERIFSVLRMTFLTGLLAMPLRDVERADAGEVLSRSTSDMDALQEVTRTGLPETIVGSVTVAMTVGGAFLLNPLIALGCLVGIPPIILSTRWYVRMAPQVYADELAARAAVSSQVTETLRGHLAVETLRLGGVRRRAAERAVDRSFDAAGMPVRLEQRWFPAVQIGYHLPLVVVVAWGAFLLRTGHAQVGDVAAVALYMRAVLLPLDDLIYWFGEAQSAGAALARILGVTEGRGGKGASVASASRQPGHDQDAVRLEHVDFAYERGRGVLHDVDLTVRDGEWVCVVGASGAGKTTLALLLAGVLTPTGGRLRVDGVGHGAAERPDVVLMTQEDHVFGGTVAENLTLVRPDAAEPEMWRALEAAGASWVKDLDEALDTALGEDAYAPTPAQARQLALARVFLRKPRVLILDEATAGLSREESERLATTLPGALHGTTVVQIAHDLWAAERSDRVIVLDGGRIVEQGRHRELLRADGPYAGLWHAWRSASFVEGPAR